MSAERPEDESDEDLGSTTYYLASRFSGERPAGRAYFQAQELIFRNDSIADLSVYRFQLDKIYHVAVVGEKPPEDFENKLKNILSAGEYVPLPSDVLKTLIIRRWQQIKTGPWVERHYRPGREYPLS